MESIGSRQTPFKFMKITIRKISCVKKYRTNIYTYTYASIKDNVWLSNELIRILEYAKKNISNIFIVR